MPAKVISWDDPEEPTVTVVGYELTLPGSDRPQKVWRDHDGKWTHDAGWLVTPYGSAEEAIAAASRVLQRSAAESRAYLALREALNDAG